MKTVQTDVAIVGAGTAGLNARKEVIKAGQKAFLIESGPYGTTCARVGCMPSKLLIAAADRAHEIETAPLFGMTAGSVNIDGAAVFKRVRSERDRFAGFVVSDTEAIAEDERACGHARFTAPTTLQIDDAIQVKANAIVIAAGSTPWLPPPFDAIADQVMVNDDVFELQDLPESIAVIGTGIIGLELGQALGRLGAAVTFFSPFDGLGPFSDPDIKEVTADILSAELDLQLSSEMLSAKPDSNGVILRWKNATGAEQEKRFEKVLVAAGRLPNLAGLDLEKSGLSLDEKGRPTWDPRTTQCGDAPIFMAGDISGHRPLLHEASDEGRIAGANAAAYPGITAHVRRTPLAVAFTDPQMGMIGKSYGQLDHDAVEIGEVSFANQGRSRVMGQNRGLLRIYGDRECCTIIGAEMIGPRAEHMAHLLAWSVQQNMTVQRALQMPFYHPVIEEGLRTALRDLAEKLKVTGDCRGEDMAEAPGT